MSRSDTVFVARARTPEEKEACFAIRREVFVEEQNVPLDRDLDGCDEAAIHFLALCDGQPIGTARVRFKDNGQTAKIERVAMRKKARGLGIGKAIMQVIEKDDEVTKANKFILNAETYVIPFYEKLGYEASGEEFMDANIPHRFMSKENLNYSSQKRTA